MKPELPKFVSGRSIPVLDFDGLEIRDYTAGFRTEASLATVTVKPGAAHKPAFSRRSNKYYFVASGEVSFQVGEAQKILKCGDFCFVPKLAHFSYRNDTKLEAKLVLMHAPAFDLEEEVFLEP